MLRPKHLLATLTIVSLFATVSSAQTNYQWRGAATGSWLTTGNWVNGVSGQYPGLSTAPGAGASTDIASFPTSVSASNVGIDMATAGGTLTLGAINFNSLSNVLVGNNSATPGILQLNGQTVNEIGRAHV